MKAYEGADLEARMGALNQAVLDAETLEGEDGDLAALSRTRWAGFHAGADPPARRVLKRVNAEFARWLQEDCPWIRLAEVAERLPDGDCGGGAIEDAARYYHALGSDRAVMMRWGASPDKIRAGLVALRRAYRDRLAEGLKALHPLMPIVRAYQERHLEPLAVVAETVTDEGGFGIQPKGAWQERPYHRIIVHGPSDGGVLAAEVADDGGADERSLPSLTSGRSPFLQFTDAVGMRPKRGRGAVREKRLLYYQILAVPLKQRLAEEDHRFRRSIRDVFAELNPNTPYRPRKHGAALMRACKALDDVLMLKPNGRPIRPVLVTEPPPTLDGDEMIRFTVTLPWGCVNGPRIYKPVLVAEGARSDPAFDLWMSMAYLWDDCKPKNGLSRIYYERPVMRRGKHGELLDMRGAPILKRDGSPETGSTHKRAVRIPNRFERNPRADRVPWLSREGLWSLAYSGSYWARSKQQRRNELAMIMRRLEAHEAAGLIAIERDPDGPRWRIVERWPELWG